MSALKQIKKVSHVIFDMDGVLLDTEKLYSKATQNVVGKYGKTYDWSIKAQMMGLKGTEVAEKIVEMLDLPITPEEYYKLAHDEYNIIMPDTQLMPGAEQLVKHLYEHKIPIAVATSSSLASFELKTAKHKAFFALFNHIVCGGSDPEVRKGKPCPDIFLVCAERFKDKPLAEKCLVFEDAPNGVAAALKAGMQVVMIPDENVPAEMLIEAPIKINRLEEAPLELFGLPPLKS
ncbi:pseudouridine-5'-phosphatase isoform X1 [Leptinotarsa decemlineata]|uniref:pseudouridine-5'-phosphatase isoform X1 n=1 Tax=Leptinotarsa decemlineata TaxID=7539 RepID=UPI000C2521D5|nr:pseudouridine-5'-phosphatase-like isoform X1 [Leptinotarsa decemlineata]